MSFAFGCAKLLALCFRGLLSECTAFLGLPLFTAAGAGGAASEGTGGVSTLAVLFTLFRRLVEGWFGGCAALGAESLLRLRFGGAAGGKASGRAGGCSSCFDRRRVVTIAASDWRYAAARCARTTVIVKL